MTQSWDRMERLTTVSSEVVYKRHIQNQHMELIEKIGETEEKLSMQMQISSANRRKEIISAVKIERYYRAFTLFSMAYSVE